MNLIKVTDGLYRNQEGTVHVTYILGWRGKPAHWVVEFTNVFGSQVKQEFRTLAMAREFLNRE